MSKKMIKEMQEVSKLMVQNFYLKFTLQGAASPVVYEVLKKEQERVQTCFSNMNRIDRHQLIEFDDVAGRAVHVNPKHVLMFQALWDAGLPKEPPESEAEAPDVILWVNGFSEPLQYHESDLQELASLAQALELADFEDAPFVSFTDQDGELVCIQADKIMMMESIDYSSALEEELNSDN